MLNNIVNGQKVKKAFILQPKKNICLLFLNVLWDEGYILGYKKSKKNKGHIEIFIKYKNKNPVINTVKFITKPSKRVYCSLKQLWKIDSNSSLLVLSTNKGILTLDKSKKLKVGGELFLYVK